MKLDPYKLECACRDYAANRTMIETLAKQNGELLKAIARTVKLGKTPVGAWNITKTRIEPYRVPAHTVKGGVRVTIH